MELRSLQENRVPSEVPSLAPCVMDKKGREG